MSLTEDQRSEIREEAKAIAQEFDRSPKRIVKVVIATATAVGSLAGGTGLIGGKSWAESQVKEIARTEAENTLDKSARIRAIETDASDAAEASKQNTKRLNAVTRNQCQLLEYLHAQDPKAPRCPTADTNGD